MKHACCYNIITCFSKWSTLVLLFWSLLYIFCDHFVCLFSEGPPVTEKSSVVNSTSETDRGTRIWQILLKGSSFKSIRWPFGWAETQLPQNEWEEAGWELNVRWTVVTPKWRSCMYWGTCSVCHQCYCCHVSYGLSETFRLPVLHRDNFEGTESLTSELKGCLKIWE